jgi:hypothetical protein
LRLIKLLPKTGLIVVQILGLIGLVVVRYWYPYRRLDVPYITGLCAACFCVWALIEFLSWEHSIEAQSNGEGLRMRKFVFPISSKTFFAYSFFMVFIWLTGLRTAPNWYVLIIMLILFSGLEFRKNQILKRVQPVLISINGNQLEVFDNLRLLKHPLASLIKISDSKFYFSKERSLSFDRADFDQDELIDFFNAMIIRYPNVEVTDQMQALLELQIVTKTNVAGGNDFNVG